jgi:hypothetical protein
VRPERNVQWNGERNAAQGLEPGAPADKGDFKIHKGLTTNRVTSTIGHLDLLIGLGLRLSTAFNCRPESSGFHLDTCPLIREIKVILNNLSLPRTLNGNLWRNSCANRAIYSALARSLQLILSLPTEWIMMPSLLLPQGGVIKGAMFQ